jgi:hypothetical protein
MQMSLPSNPTSGSPSSTKQATEEPTNRVATQTASATADRASAVAGATTQEMRDVAQHAQEQFGTVVDEARDQALKVVSSATSELNDQLEQRLDGATQTARTTASELQALADGRVEDAGRTGELVRQAGDRLERFADRVDELGVRGVTGEITDFARRRPVAFLVSAAALGIMVGRLARAGKELSDDTPASTSTDQTPARSAPPVGQQPRPQAGEEDLTGLAAPSTAPAGDQPPVPSVPTTRDAGGPMPHGAPQYGTAPEVR